jgi:hypothetical protein
VKYLELSDKDWEALSDSGALEDLGIEPTIRTPTDPQEIRDDLEESLIRGADIFLNHRGFTENGVRCMCAGDVIALMKERARNLAEGFRHRVIG